jgi:hypothetical protein
MARRKLLAALPSIYRILKQRQWARAEWTSRFYKASNYQWLALDPVEPGVKIGLSCGTVASPCEVDSSMTPSSREAQAEIRNAIANSETTYDAKRGIIGTNLTSDMFDASRGVR